MPCAVLTVKSPRYGHFEQSAANSNSKALQGVWSDALFESFPGFSSQVLVQLVLAVYEITATRYQVFVCPRSRCLSYANSGRWDCNRNHLYGFLHGFLLLFISVEICLLHLGKIIAYCMTSLFVLIL